MRTIHVEMIGWLAGFFAQSSALSPQHSLLIDPERSSDLFDIATNRKNLIPKQGTNNLLLTILPFFFIVTATNLAIPKINLYRIDVVSGLLFESQFKYILLPEVCFTADFAPLSKDYL
jgi:hypothetical protein